MSRIIIILILISNHMMGQNELPYYNIPEAPTEYTAGTVASRVLDGLGYRYYWATEGLRIEDLNYKISSDSRPAGETLDHILGLTTVILNAIEGKPNEGRANDYDQPFSEKRRKTLQNIHRASKEIRHMNQQEISAITIVFKREERISSFPLWNLLNGPIADAIYHVGQIVTYRRASGNPLPSGVSVFTGITREQ